LRNAPTDENTARIEALEDSFVELLLLIANEDGAMRAKLLQMFDKIETDFVGMNKPGTAKAVATLRESFRHG
jgi:hypothetical protein